MKKTFLISLFLLFTSSVFAVSIPGGGLGTEEHVSDDYFYFDGFGLRSAEQVGQEASKDNLWEGTWNTTGGGGTTAVEAMGEFPAEYAHKNWKRWGVGDGDVYYSPNIFDRLVSDVVGECTDKDGALLDCQNYAVDVYNIAIGQYYETQLTPGGPPTYKGYYAAPVSTDVALMALFAGAYLAFALWRKKRSVAKI